MNIFSDLKGKTAVITGGTGMIGGAIVATLVQAGVQVAIIGRDQAKATARADEIAQNTHGICKGYAADVCSATALKTAHEAINADFGGIDFLINCAGGNKPAATTKLETMNPLGPDVFADTFFNLDPAAITQVFDLNLMGTVLPVMEFGRDLITKKSGVILTISSMAALRPLTKIPAYSAAKAAIDNFTRWLSVHCAPASVRVNAIAPGFFITEQNRALLTDEKTGEPTARGKKIIAHTPLQRFGTVSELAGLALFLLSDQASFITGAIIPVDGGFSAYAGV